MTCTLAHVIPQLSELVVVKPWFTTMEENLSLTTADYEKVFQLNGFDPLLDDANSYRCLIGHLIYLTMTTLADMVAYLTLQCIFLGYALNK